MFTVVTALAFMGSVLIPSIRTLLISGIAGAGCGVMIIAPRDSSGKRGIVRGFAKGLKKGMS